MSNEHELIANLLENFQQTKKGIEKEVENLLETNGFSEEELAALKTEMNGLYKVNLAIESLIVSVLDEKYNPIDTRKNILQKSLLHTIKRGSEKSSALELFVKNNLHD